MIDVLSSDQDVSNHLSETLHRSLDPICSESHGHSVYEPCPFFQCRKDPCFESVRKLEACFKYNLVENKVTPGMLLVFSSAQCVESHACFLGVVLKKPSVHMLAEASITDENQVNEVQLALALGAPKVLTSQQLFSQFCRDASSSADQVIVKVEVWQCKAFLHGRDQLKSNIDKQVAAFSLTQSGFRRAKPVVKLPFGLTDRKPRKKTTRTRTVIKVQAKTKTARKTAKGKGDFENVVRHLVGSSDEGANSESSESSEEEDIEIEANDESEVVAPASSTIAKEEKSFPELKAEVEQLDQLRAEAAAALKQNSAKAAATSSYFSREIGLSEGAIAVSARSVCLSCKKQIPKGTVRFSWYHSVVRPPAWIHHFCLVTHAKHTGLSAETCRKLEKIIEATGRASSSSQAPPVCDAVRTAATKILNTLRSTT